jgi:hypothetical protein
MRMYWRVRCLWRSGVCNLQPVVIECRGLFGPFTSNETKPPCIKPSQTTPSLTATKHVGRCCVTLVNFLYSSQPRSMPLSYNTAQLSAGRTIPTCSLPPLSVLPVHLYTVITCTRGIRGLFLPPHHGCPYLPYPPCTLPLRKRSGEDLEHRVHLEKQRILHSHRHLEGSKVLIPECVQRVAHRALPPSPVCGVCACGSAAA